MYIYDELIAEADANLAEANDRVKRTWLDAHHDECVRWELTLAWLRTRKAQAAARA